MWTERKWHPVTNYRHLTSIVSWLPNIILRNELSIYSSSACCTCNSFVYTEIKMSIRMRLKQKCTNPGRQFAMENKGRFTHSMPRPCRARAVPLPCRAAKGLEYVFPIWFTQCGRVWFTLAMPCPRNALPMPFFSRPQQSTAVERRPVGYLLAFGFFRLPRGVPRRLLSEAYQSSSQRSIPTIVKSGSSTRQKRRSVKLLD